MQKIVQSQTNFTGGEIDVQGKRRIDGEPLAKTACRTLSNWRPLESGTLSVRPGRRGLAITGNGRAERFRMTPTQELLILFSTNSVTITDLSGNTIVTNTSASYLWTAATVAQISWCVCPDRVVICYPGMQPQLIMWDSSTNTFSFVAFTFPIVLNQTQEPFYRFAARGATLSWDSTGTNTTGPGQSFPLTCSVAYFTAAMVGQILSVGGAQVQITGFTSSTVVQVTNLSQMPAAAVVTLTAGSTTSFYPQGILATTTLDSWTFEVAGNAPNPLGGTYVFGAVSITGSVFNSGTGSLITALGSSACGGATYYGGVVQTVRWQQQFMSAAQGWPSVCFFDRDRLGFCGFPQLPEAILWSAVGAYDTFWVDAAAAAAQTAAGTAPTAAILEFIAGKPSVKNVVGWSGDEFVFTDKGIYQIPIGSNGSGALVPGSVSFIQLSDDSANGVRPVITKNAVIFVNGGGTRVGAILRTGAITTPYVAQDLTEFYEHLITSPIFITISAGDGQFPERYIYVLNSNGTIAIGRITGDQPMGSKQYVGWQPWTGNGTVEWVSASLGGVYYLTNYGGTSVIEVEDDTVFLDQAIILNSTPANMILPGKGPFVAFANGSVRLMSGEIDYGDRSVDANGNIIAQPTDNMTVSTLIAGKTFSSTIWPFVHEAGGEKDQDMMQRQRRRRVSRGIVTVVGSSGFSWGDREIPPYDFGDDPTAAPPLRETSYTCRPVGRDYDPPPPILIKDTPGPLDVLEISLEVTV